MIVFEVQFLDFNLVLAQSLPANSLKTSFKLAVVDAPAAELAAGAIVVLASVIVISYVPALIVSVLSDAAVLNTVTRFSRLEASAAFLDF